MASPNSALASSEVAWRVDALTWTTKPNVHPHPEANGQDAFIALANEMPGLVALGPTAKSAVEIGKKAAAREFAVASESDLDDLDALQAHVQFNNRITVAQKARIVRRAKEARVSTRQFMLNQCLYAPTWQEPPQMPADQKSEQWQAIADASADGKPAPEKTSQ